MGGWGMGRTRAAGAPWRRGASGAGWRPAARRLARGSPAATLAATGAARGWRRHAHMGITRGHAGSDALTWSHVGPHALTWSHGRSHAGSRGVTWGHVGSRGVTWGH
eukprot:1630252-Prymnesium_polylepis.1